MTTTPTSQMAALALSQAGSSATMADIDVPPPRGEPKLNDDCLVMIADAVVGGGPWPLDNERVCGQNDWGGWQEMQEQRYLAYKKWVQTTRFASRAFDRALRPHVFSTWDLSENVVLRKFVDAEGYPENELAQCISTYTTALALLDVFDADLLQATAKIIRGCRKLNRARWSIPFGLCSKDEQGIMASTYLAAYMDKTPSCVLIIDKRHVEMFSRTKTKNESGTHIDIRAGPGKVCNVSTQARQPRRSLTITNRGVGNFQQLKPIGAKFPAVHKLKLDQYYWRHTAEEISQLWDFSILRSLTLKYINLATFLRSISQLDTSQLRTLKLSQVYLYDRLRDSPSRPELRNLIANTFTKMPRLEKLKLDFQDWRAAIPSPVLRHLSGSLRSLRLKDLKQPLTDSDLPILKETLPLLEELSTYFLLTKTESYHNIVASLISWRSLNKLTLLVEDPERLRMTSQGSSDLAYDDVEALMRKLHDKKQGESFKEIKVWVWGHGLRGRPFVSKMNDYGQYVQSGSERKVSAEVKDELS